MMSAIPRRKISEIKFLYEHHSERRDVYVEGVHDVAVYRWCLSQLGLTSVAVYPVSSIDISDDEVLNNGATPGNRGRLIFLAHKLKSIAENRCACVIDADFSHFLGEPDAEPPLFRTDYTCLEMYYFNSYALDKYLSLVCRRSDISGSEIVSRLSPTLSQMFIFRCANHTLGLNLDWIDRVTCCSLNNGIVDFDFRGFMIKILNKNAQGEKAPILEQEISRLNRIARHDYRFQSQGHDFLRLFSWYLKESRIRREPKSEGEIRSEMMMALDVRYLSNERLFGLLLRWLG